MHIFWYFLFFLIHLLSMTGFHQKKNKKKIKRKKGIEELEELENNIYPLESICQKQWEKPPECTCCWKRKYTSKRKRRAQQVVAAHGEGEARRESESCSEPCSSLEVQRCFCYNTGTFKREAICQRSYKILDYRRPKSDQQSCRA